MVAILTRPTMLRDEHGKKKQGNEKLASIPSPPRASPPSSRLVDSPTVLGPQFVPGFCDVICDRKKQAREHSGNVRFQKLVNSASVAYGIAKAKPERAAIVTDLVNSVRSHGTGFVKKDKKTGQWIEVGDRLAREKTGQQLRETLGGKYRSSQDSKRQARKAKNDELIENLELVVQRNSTVSETVDHMKEKVPSWFMKPDQEVLGLFTDANRKMLDAMKQDDTLGHLFENKAKNATKDATSSSASFTTDSSVDDDDGEHEPNDTTSMEV